MGLEPVDDLPATLLVALNAGGLFQTSLLARIPFVSNLLRVNSPLYRQSTALLGDGRALPSLRSKRAGTESRRPIGGGPAFCSVSRRLSIIRSGSGRMLARRTKSSG